MTIRVARLKEDAKLPTRKNKEDAGMDFYAYGDYIIEPLGMFIVSTGVTVEVPKGYMLLLKPKGRNDHLVGAGVVDSFYEPGEIKIKIFNPSPQGALVIRHGDAIGQGVMIKIYGDGELEEVNASDLTSKSNRSASGGILRQTSLLSEVID